MLGFAKTGASVQKLLDLLRCDNCSRTLHEPYTTGVCTHTLCMDCCCNSLPPAGSRSKRHTGSANVCPKCNIPVRPCDAKPHPQLSSLVLVARRLAKLLSLPPSTYSEEVTPLSRNTIGLNDGIDFIKKDAYCRVESPSPPSDSQKELTPASHANATPLATAISPVECAVVSAIALPENAEVVEIEPLETTSPEVLMMPPPLNPGAKSIRRSGPKQHVATSSSEEAESDPKAPLASPEKSCLTDTSFAEKPNNTSRSSLGRKKPTPLKRSATLKLPSVELRTTKRSSAICKSKSALDVSGGVAGFKTFMSTVELKLNSKGESVIHRAAIKNDVPLLKKLLANGLSPNIRDHAGWTPLHEAVLRGHVEAAECLLKEGDAVVDMPGGPDLETALHEAVVNRRVECVQLLLRYHADPNFTNGHGLTTLQVCDKAIEENRAAVLVKDRSRKDSKKYCHASQALETFKTIKGILEEASTTQSSKPPTQDDASLKAEGDKASNSAASKIFTERRRLRPVILGTGLSRLQRTQLARVASIIHARVASEMSSEVTHLITGTTIGTSPKDKKRKKADPAKTPTSASHPGATCPRTLKFLLAVLQGCWILSFDWIETCEVVKMRVEEEAFEVMGCNASPQSGSSRRARRAREAGSAGLFHGFRFCLLGNFAYPTPSRVDLAALITAGGGTVFSREISSPSRLAYLAVDNPVIAGDWTVQAQLNTSVGGDTAPPSPPTPTPTDRTVHLHQLIALFDTRVSDSGNSGDGDPKPGQISSPNQLVNSALSMLQPKKVIQETAVPPIRLLPAAWVMDCVAAYSILPAPDNVPH
ncbi:unnamed protein product [Mesocestoides corti]|uniref:BRCA1-associated RING domain protein 1 n=2 Tax=Mesocestoides corti TaxID=53468 RepID=A0A0R3UA91_MESCO|nr:unnamed protein product [Mesocestoides corti]